MTHPRSWVPLLLCGVALACGDDPAGPVPDIPPEILGSVEINADVDDMAYDPERDALYLAQPALSRVAVLDLGTMTFQAPIEVPFEFNSLDLSPGGDSLVIASMSSAALGIVDLRLDPRTLAIYTLESAVTLERFPVSVRALSTGEMLVTLASAVSGCDTGRFLLVNLASGAEEVLDHGFDCALERIRLAATSDRSSVLVHIAGECCAEDGRIFDPVSRTFGDEIDVGPRDEPALSISDDGDILLIGNRLIALRDTPGATVDITVSGDVPTVTALSPAGTEAYFIRGARLHRVRVTYTGVRWVSSPSWTATLPRNVSTFPPEEFTRVKVLPDGRIVVVSTERVHLLADE